MAKDDTDGEPEQRRFSQRDKMLGKKLRRACGGEGRCVGEGGITKLHAKAEYKNRETKPFH